MHKWIVVLPLSTRASRCAHCTKWWRNEDHEPVGCARTSL